MTVNYFLENPDAFEVIPYLESTVVPLIVAGIFIIVCVCLFFNALKERGLFKKLMGTIIPSILFIAVTFFGIPLIIGQSHLSWVMNETYLILYDEEASDFRSVWEWKQLSVHLSDYYETDSDTGTSRRYYKIQLINEDGKLVHAFDSDSLDSLARAVKPFAKYLSNFSEQILTHSLISRETTHQFLSIFNQI